MTLSLLGDACRDQGKHDEAEALFRRSLAILEKVLGPEHPDVAKPLQGWGRLHVARGDHASAEPVLKRALAVRRQVLGSAHPDTAESLQDYAALLRTMMTDWPTFWYSTQSPISGIRSSRVAICQACGQT